MKAGLIQGSAQQELSFRILLTVRNDSLGECYSIFSPLFSWANLETDLLSEMKQDVIVLDKRRVGQGLHGGCGQN